MEFMIVTPTGNMTVVRYTLLPFWIQPPGAQRLERRPPEESGRFDQMAKHANSFDMILNTVSANLDVDAYLRMLRVDGTLVNVGAPSAPDKFHAFSLIGARRSLAGSSIGGLADTQEMLDFCAAHGVKPEIELIGADAVADAYERVVRSAVRYRFVIDAATIA